MLRFSRTRNVKAPEYGTPGSAGIDFFVPFFDSELVLLPHSDLLIPSGIKVDIPDGYMLLGANKSGVAVSKYGAAGCGIEVKKTYFDSSVVVGANVIDSDYQGEIHIHIINTGPNKLVIEPGRKIVQFILVPVAHEELVEIESDKLFDNDTERGSGLMGSTGIY